MKSLKIDETLHRRIKQQSLDNNQSIQEFITMVFDEYFNECKSRKVEKDTIPTEGPTQDPTEGPTEVGSDVENLFENWLGNRNDNKFNPKQPKTT
jgi:hypothetical protein